MAAIDRRGATVSAADPPITTNPNPDLAIKAPVVVATTGVNIALAGVQAIDGVTVGNNSERVLVKDQTDPTTNGIYTAASGNWTRSVDGANNSQWAYGTQVLVTHGAANASTTWELTAASPIVLGTSAMTFVELGTKQLIPLHVFVWFGDSNIPAQGSSATSPPVAPGTVLQYAQDGSVTDLVAPAKTAFAPGQNANTGGPQQAFGNAYYRETGVRSGHVICGVGATTQCAAADLGSGNWDTTGTLLPAMYAARVAAMAPFAAKGYAPVFKGYIGDVGANDGLQIDNAVINVGQYQTSATNAFAMIRTLEGDVTTPIYLIQTGSNTNPSVSDTGYAQVRAAQFTMQQNDRFLKIVCFNRIDFVARGMMQPNSAHPVQAGYDEEGELIAANIISNQARIGWQQNGQDIYYTRGNVTVGYPVSSGVAFGVNKSPTVLPVGLAGTVAQFATADGSAARLEAFGIGNGPSFSGRRANGTMAAPTRVANNDFLVTFGAAGYDAVAGWSTNAAGAMAVRAAEDWVDASHHGSKLVFFVTPSATASAVTALTINQDKTLTAAAYGAGVLQSDASGNLRIVSATTGSGNLVFATSPTLTTPVLGVASATSLAAANIYGGSGFGATLNLQSTSNGSPAADSLTLTTGGVVRATWLSGGNVGFGTETNPQFPFVFSGNATTGINGSNALGIGAFGGPWMMGATSGIVGWNVLSVAAVGNNNFVRIDGTVGSPTNLQSGDVIAALNFGGWGAGAFQGGRAQVLANALETWTTTFGIGLQFKTAAAGGARAQSAYLMGGLIVSSSSVTDPAAGGILADGAGIYFPGIGTTASAANAFINTGSTPANQLQRSTSSLRYKRDVEDLDAAHAAALMKLRPVWYRSKAANDNPAWSWFGFIAEEVAAIEPRLVHYGYLPDDYDDQAVDEPDEDGVMVRRTNRVLKPGAQLVPDSVMYDRVAVLAVAALQNHEARIAALEHRAAA